MKSATARGVAKTLTDGGDYELLERSYLTSTGSHALVLGGSKQQYDLNVRGNISANMADGAGIYLKSSNSADIYVAETSLVKGAYGFYSAGSTAEANIYNNGNIVGAIDGIRIMADGDHAIKSVGDVTGKHAGIYFSGDGSLKIIFQGILQGEIISTGNSKENLSVSGELHGGMSLGAGDDLVHLDTIKDGLMLGTADLGAGEDIYYGCTKPDTVVGGTGDDLLCGFGGDDVLYGGSGEDNVQGGRGVDQLYGGSGNDDYHVDAQHDVIHEKAGDANDRLFTYASYALAKDDDIEAMFCRITDDKTAMDLTGNALDQQIFGNAGNNVLKGLDGNDKLYGNGGEDILDGGKGADIMYGDDKSNDTYVVDNVDDRIREPGGGSDLVMSSISYKLGDGLNHLALTGDQEIDGKGNEAANIIAGNSAKNVLIGGDGDDTFLFNTAFGKSNYDTIADFVHSDDTFKLDNAVFQGLSRGTLSRSSFQIVESTTDLKGVDGDDYILYDKDDGNLFFDRDGSGSRYGRVIFAVVDNNTALDYSDFVAF